MALTRHRSDGRGAARSSASPASPATARASCSRRSPASALRRRRRGDRDRRPRRADGVGIDAPPAAAAPPSCRRSGSATPPRRRTALSENASSSHHATGEVSRGGFVALGRGATPGAERIVAELRRAQGRSPIRRPASSRAATCRNSSSAARSSAARPARRRPADLGRRCRRRATDPAGAVDLAGEGAAVLVISQDLDELFEIADRIAVIHDGASARCRPTREWTARSDRARNDGRRRRGSGPCGLSSSPRAELSRRHARVARARSRPS